MKRAKRYIQLTHQVTLIVVVFTTAIVASSCGTARQYPPRYTDDYMYGVHNQEDITKKEQFAEFMETMSYDTPYGEKLLRLYADEYERPSSYATYAVGAGGVIVIDPIYWGSTYGDWGFGYRHNYPWWRGPYRGFGYWNSPYYNFGWGGYYGYYGYYVSPFYNYWDPFYNPYYSYWYGWGGIYPPYYRPSVRPHYKRVNRSIVQTANPYTAPSSRSTRNSDGSTVGRSSSSSVSSYNRTTTPTRSSVTSPSRAPSSSSSSSSSIKTNAIGR